MAGKQANNTFTFWLVLISYVLTYYMPLKVEGQDNQANFQCLTTKDGLSNNIINCLLQDKKGYLWICTYDGLNRFNGYSFTHFQHDPSDKKSIANGPVSAIMEGRDQTIWIGTVTGNLCKFNHKTETFETITELQKYSKNEKLTISTLKEDKNGNLWIGTLQKGLLQFDIKRNQIIEVKDKNGKFNLTQVVSLFDDYQGDLLVGTYELGFLNFNYKNNTFSEIFTNKNDRALINFSHVQCIFPIYKSLYLIGTKNGWATYNKKDRSIKKYHFLPILSDKPENISVTSITKDKNGFFWLSTNRGIFKFDLVTGKTKQFIHDPLKFNSLSSNSAKQIITDISNNLWIASDEGLNKLDAHRGNFIKYNSKYSGQNKLNNKGIRTLYEDKSGILWVGTEGGGINKIEKIKNTVYKPDLKYTEGFGFNYINTIFEDKEGNIWVGTPRGVHILNKINGKFKRIYFPNMKKENWINFSTWSIFEDKDDKMWIGTQLHGLFYFDKKKNVFISYGQKGNKKLLPESVWAIFQDSKNNLWFGTNNGVYRLKKSSNSFEKIGNGNTEEKKLHGENVWWFHEDKQNKIWIATSDGGLNKFDPAKGNFLHYTTDHGLPSNAISAILEDNHGKLWISTVNGLCKFDPETGRAIRNYHIEDGLQGNHFNFKSAWKNSKGEMFFGEQLGFIKFHPDSVAFNSAEPNISIASFKVLYNEAKKQLLADSSIVLPYNQNSFSFDFASLDLTNPEKNQFSYILEGFDDKCINAGTRHFVSYTNLDPGKYIFKLKGTNSDGLWNSNDVTFRITILPPFWQTWWFRSIIALIIIGFSGTSLYLFYKRNSEKRRRVQSELSALRNQLNPHFVFNSLTSLQHFIIENQRNLALDYLSKFAVLMRMILENSKQETISLDAEKQFLELYLYMEAARFEHKFGIKINIDESLNAKNTNIPPMLLQPVVENAIKHGLIAKKKDGKIEVSFIKKNKHSILCIVEDNGVGRNKAGEAKAKSNICYQSMSTEIIEEKLSLINKKKNRNTRLTYIDLYDVDGQPLGTRAELELPLTTA